MSFGRSGSSCHSFLPSWHRIKKHNFVKQKSQVMGKMNKLEIIGKIEVPSFSSFGMSILKWERESGGKQFWTGEHKLKIDGLTISQSLMMVMYDSPCSPQNRLKVLKSISHQFFLSLLAAAPGDWLQLWHVIEQLRGRAHDKQPMKYPDVEENTDNRSFCMFLFTVMVDVSISMLSNYFSTAFFTNLDQFMVWNMPGCLPMWDFWLTRDAMKKEAATFPMGFGRLFAHPPDGGLLPAGWRSRGCIGLLLAPVGSEKRPGSALSCDVLAFLMLDIYIKLHWITQ